MQIRSFRGSGEPVWVSALPSAGVRLGPDPRRALGPAATPAASTGRTRDRTRPMLHERQNVLATAPSTRDPWRTWRTHSFDYFACERAAGGGSWGVNGCSCSTGPDSLGGKRHMRIG